MDPLIKLFDFNVITDAAGADDGDCDEVSTGFTVQMFGIDEGGGQVAIEATGFQPFFYARVSDSWSSGTRAKFTEFLRKKMGALGSSLIDARLMLRKALYGFDDDKKYRFIYLTFANMDAFNRAKGLWYIGTWAADNRRLNPEGLVFDGTATRLYESNIPPLIRMFHVQDISPSGWVRLPRNRYKELSESESRTTCAREFIIPSRYIEAVNNMEKGVPYLKMSFDIEASSSHGDFPIPIKTYKKLASNIVDMLDKCTDISDEDFCGLIRRSIYVAFGYNIHTDVLANDVDCVFPTKTVTVDMIQNRVEHLLTEHIDTTSSASNEDDLVEDMFERKGVEYMGTDEGVADGIADGIVEDAEPIVEEVVEGHPFFKGRHRAPKRKQAANEHPLLIALLRRKDETRENKIIELTGKLRKYFPKLEGDKVTFIG